MVDKRHRKEWHAHLRPTCLRTSVDHDRGAINAALTKAITLWIFCPSSLDCALKILFNTWAGQCQWAVSMGGSNELVECFCGGAVAEGCSGAVVELVGDGVEVGLVAGDASMLRRPLIWRGVRPCDKSKITRRRRISSRSRSRFFGWRLATCATLPASPGPGTRRQSTGAGDLGHNTEGLRPTRRAIHTWDKPTSDPTVVAARSPNTGHPTTLPPVNRRTTS